MARVITTKAKVIAWFLGATPEGGVLGDPVVPFEEVGDEVGAVVSFDPGDEVGVEVGIAVFPAGSEGFEVGVEVGIAVFPAGSEGDEVGDTVVAFEVGDDVGESVVPTK
jgi:hypothetical protein